MDESKCSCCASDNAEVVIGKYVCYCNHVTEQDIVDAIINGAKDVKEVIKVTGAMKNSNCAVNNPKGTCCYSDIVYVFKKHSK
jgi:bacterioferritin-associated ferredoxin